MFQCLRFLMLLPKPEPPGEIVCAPTISDPGFDKVVENALQPQLLDPFGQLFHVGGFNSRRENKTPGLQEVELPSQRYPGKGFPFAHVLLAYATRHSRASRMVVYSRGFRLESFSANPCSPGLVNIQLAKSLVFSAKRCLRRRKMA